MAHWPSSAGPCGPFCTCCPVRHAAGLPLNSNVRPQSTLPPMNRALCILLPVLLMVTANASAVPSALVLEKKVGHLDHYKGTVMLKGVAERRVDKEALEVTGDNLCFIVSITSRAQIPRDSDGRAAWFCFTEPDSAIRALKLPKTPAKGTCGYSAPATVIVGSYVANRQESQVFDTASLLAVKQRGKLRSIPCS
jgi:hypothetical protein